MANHLNRRQLMAWATACAAAAATPALATPHALHLSPLPLRERRLANGLQVISVEDHQTASVSVQVWYKVGSKDDPVDRSGFAHLFEHMMFKRTQHMPSEMFDRLTEDVGGQNNAYTAEDMTVYQSEVPANHLERLLWAESERLAHLQVDQANFESERKVVIEELRERVLADPYGRLFNALPSYVFEVHPYQRPGIGNEAELNAATLDDVRNFHRTYYRPDNAVLIVVGAFETAQFDAWVDRYFAPLRTLADPIPRISLKEPARAQDQRATLSAPNVPLPALALMWKAPGAAHADGAALHVAAALLAQGESSRLNEALVYRDQVAQSVGFSADLFADAGMLTAYAVAASTLGKARSSSVLEAALMGQINALAKQGPSAAELDKVRTQLLTAALLARQTPQGQAEAMGRAALLAGDVRQANEELAHLQAVGARDVQRVLADWVLKPKRVTLEYIQGKS